MVKADERSRGARPSGYLLWQEGLRAVIVVGSFFTLFSVDGPGLFAVLIALPLLLWCLYTAASAVLKAFAGLVFGIAVMAVVWSVTDLFTSDRYSGYVGAGLGLLLGASSLLVASFKNRSTSRP